MSFLVAVWRRDEPLCAIDDDAVDATPTPTPTPTASHYRSQGAKECDGVVLAVDACSVM